MVERTFESNGGPQVEIDVAGGSQDGEQARVPLVVVGVDASEESKDALRWAKEYAELTGASLQVVHAWHLADEHAWIQPLPPPAGPTDVARAALQEVVDAVLGADPSIDVTVEVVEGHAARVLTDAARGASWLVVGSTGLGGFDGIVLGSVSQHCVARATCSVAVVRSPEGRRRQKT
jgi:nucleotide-binding universal stress UspA family protein